MKRINLKLFRISQDLTQAEMAAKLKISTSHYKSIELGIHNPSLKILQRFGTTFEGEYKDVWETFKLQ